MKEMKFLGKNGAFECLGSFVQNAWFREEWVEFKLQIHLIELEYVFE